MSAATNTAGLPKRTARHSLREATGSGLLPCPFCGAHVWDTGCTTTPEVGELHYVWCWACHAQSAMHLTRANAMAHWNRRRYIHNLNQPRGVKSANLGRRADSPNK